MRLVLGSVGVERPERELAHVKCCGCVVNNEWDNVHTTSILTAHTHGSGTFGNGKKTRLCGGHDQSQPSVLCVAVFWRFSGGFKSRKASAHQPGAKRKKRVSAVLASYFGSWTSNLVLPIRRISGGLVQAQSHCATATLAVDRAAGRNDSNKFRYKYPDPWDRFRDSVHVAILSRPPRHDFAWGCSVCPSAEQRWQAGGGAEQQSKYEWCQDSRVEGRCRLCLWTAAD